jgi:hypothetical protein
MKILYDFVENKSDFVITILDITNYPPIREVLGWRVFIKQKNNHKIIKILNRLYYE